MKVALTIALIVSALSCGPQFDREAMQEVRDTYCVELLKLADDAELKGVGLTSDEKAAVEFCKGK